MNKIRLSPLLFVLLALLTLALACSRPMVQAGQTPLPEASATPAILQATVTPTYTPQPTPTQTPLPVARVASADLALFYGDYDTAMTAYQAAGGASNDPDIQAATLLGQGRILYLTHVYPNALDVLRSVTINYPSTQYAAEAYYYLGLTLEELDRYSEAAEAYASYRELRPGLIDAYISEKRGDDLKAAGDLNGALVEYSRAVSQPRLPTDFSLELKLADTYVTTGDFSTAQVVYDDIYSRTDSDYVRAQLVYGRGQMYLALGQPDQAYAAYLEAVNYYPRAYYAYLALVELVNAGIPVDELQRGLVDYFAGEYGVAVAAFDRYLAAGGAEAGTALYYKGLILRSQEDYPGALAQWEAVITGYPDSDLWDEAWEQKAYTQWAYLDDYPAAQQTLLDFVGAAPVNPRAAEFLFDAGRVAERDGRLADAAWLWGRIPGEYPASTYVYRSYFLSAICQYRLGNYEAAEQVFWQAQSVATTSGERAGALLWMGKSQAGRGNLANAQTTWQQTTAVDPTGYYSERAYDLLGGLAPFTPPAMFDLGVDRKAEIADAEAWLRSTFSLAPETNLSVPGPLAGDLRFVRGNEFWLLGEYELAAAEFENLRMELINDPLANYRLAVYLSDLGLYRQAIIAARQVLHLANLPDTGLLNAPALFNHIRFGVYYRDLVVPAAQQYGFHPLFAWSVLRQESFFEGFIQSSAGARGLMQVMPATGFDIARIQGWPPDYTSADLYRPLVSIQFGLDYLSNQRDYLDGDLFAALAAYNGGPGNAAAWRELANGDPDLFVEIIRFDETRQYVTSIYEVFAIYRRIYGRLP